MKIFTYLMFFLLLGSCAKDSGVPAYLYISETSLKTDYSKEGSNSSKITDVWVQVNNKKLGVFELPATVPVLEDGLKSIYISPGIKVNGIAASRATYIFYKSYEENIMFVPGKVSEIKPQYEYARYAIFDWIEDFEGIGTSFSTGTNSQASMESISDKSIVFEGNQCGMVKLGTNQYSFTVNSEKEYTLNKGGAAVYLELNYMITNTMYISLYAISQGSVEQIQVMSLTAKTDSNGDHYWNKIYINLTAYVSNSVNAQSYKVLFSGAKEDEGDAYFYFDNIKLIHQ